MRRSALTPLLLAVALTTVACSPGGEDPAGASSGSPVTASPGTGPSGSSSAQPQETAEAADLPVLSWRGFGDLRFGMTPDEAASALGIELVRTSGYTASRAEMECAYLEPGPASGLPSGLGFMVTGPGDGVIDRVDVGEGPYRTDGGIGIGDDRAAVEALQPEGIRVQPSEVAVDLTVITVNPLDDATSTVEAFDVDPDGVVVSFRAGEREEVSYSEGCS